MVLRLRVLGLRVLMQVSEPEITAKFWDDFLYKPPLG